jgi:hypothetical protein
VQEDDGRRVPGAAFTVEELMPVDGCITVVDDCHLELLGMRNVVE